MPSRPAPRTRLAVALLLATCACLVAVLIACPPSNPRSRAQPEREKQPEPAMPTLPPVRTETSAGTTPPTSRPERPEAKGMLAVVIDDAGYSLEELQGFLDLPGPVTIAVLPSLPNSREAARRVAAAGKDLILHCPMEALGGENAGPGALRADQSPAEIAQALASAFASVPGAIGMNNHMGSKATADAALMSVVMDFLGRRGLFFLDSRTTAETVGEETARSAGVPYLSRDIFIDAGRSAEEIARAFESGTASARARGSAVMIGHVQNRGVLDILRAGERGLGEQGIRLARLEDILRRREKEPSR